MCNAGCTSTAQQAAYNVIMNFSAKLLASEVNTLKDFIAAEVSRRSVTSASIANVTAGSSMADDAWWESLRTNLAKILTTSGAQVSAGELITAAKRNKLRDYAVSAYNTVVPVNTST